MWKEHDVVTVTVDVSAEGLSAGDVGAIVHCYPDQNTYEVDFLDDQGRSKGVATVCGSHLLRLNLVSLVA